MFILLWILVGFLIGFYLGRRRGVKEGKEIAELYAPLQIRKDTLESGVCPICKTPVDCFNSTPMIE